MDESKDKQSEALGAPRLRRRELLSRLTWVVPAVVSTAAVRARAGSGTCAPSTPCAPVL
jgi:hypothetical protein